MTKDEIRKALECCYECPYFDGLKHKICVDEKLHKDTLNLITEQEEEIEKKVQIIKNLNGLIDYADKEIRKLKAENKQAKIDVLKELKTRHDYAIKNMGYPWDISQQIDELIKEVEKQ